MSLTSLHSLGRAIGGSGLFLGCLLAWAQPAEAMRVSPMIVELTTSGTGSTARVEVQNINPGSLQFEVRVTRLDFTDDGKIKETPADGDFLVFPPQGSLANGARQVVRLQWVGGQLPSSRGYYVSINQLPISLDANPSGQATAAQVQVVYHIKVLTTVAPPNSQPKVNVESAVPAMVAAPQAPGMPASAAGPTQPGIAVTIRNTGRRYALMAGSQWTIDGTGADGKPLKVVLNRDDLSHILGAGYVPAIDGRRTFEVPTGKAFAKAPIKISFSD
jgi:fimbrial chaperone protein